MTHNDNTNCLARPNLTRIRRNPTTLANSPVTMDSDPTAITIAASPLFKLPAELKGEAKLAISNYKNSSLETLEAYEGRVYLVNA